MLATNETTERNSLVFFEPFREQLGSSESNLGMFMLVAGLNEDFKV